MSSACRCPATPKARAARATRRALPPSPARPPRRSTASTVLAAEIEDRPDNTTRFFVLGRKLFEPSGEDRTTLLVSVAHTDSSGALFRLLEPLSKHKVNMTRIESRPSHRRKWDYVFFIDIEGHADDEPVAKALAALKQRASLFRVLGSYPRAVST